MKIFSALIILFLFFSSFRRDGNYLRSGRSLFVRLGFSFLRGESRVVVMTMMIFRGRGIRMGGTMMVMASIPRRRRGRTVVMMMTMALPPED
ncbi:MAG: hypothetical protein J5698_04015 [Bacteroidaceae bacterium]|nr:hypothetical protein [Bacteroidaceae bacterium]